MNLRITPGPSFFVWLGTRDHHHGTRLLIVPVGTRIAGVHRLPRSARDRAAGFDLSASDDSDYCSNELMSYCTQIDAQAERLFQRYSTWAAQAVATSEIMIVERY